MKIFSLYDIPTIFSSTQHRQRESQGIHRLVLDGQLRVGVRVQREVRHPLRRFQRSREEEDPEVFGQVLQQDRFSQQLRHLHRGTLDLLPRFVSFRCFQ